MIGVEVGAHARVNTGGLATGAFDLAALAGKTIHVGGGPAEIGDDTGKPRHRIADRLDFTQHRTFRSTLDDAAFVFGDRAKCAPTEAAPLDRDREADHLVGRDIRIAIERVRSPLVRQLIDLVHFFGGQRDRRRIEPHLLLPVALHQCTRITRIGLEVQDARRVCIHYGIVDHLLERGQPDDAAVAIGCLDAAYEANDLRRRLCG